MTISQEAIDLENRSIGKDGEATLAAAYRILKTQWDGGDQDREIGLHLMFLCWYGMIEPKHITGFEESTEVFNELEATFEKTHAFFEPKIGEDAEMLWVVGLVAHMHWFMFTNREKWKRIAQEYRKLYRALKPNGIDPEDFDGRGAYGDYFKRQALVADGY